MFKKKGNLTTPEESILPQITDDEEEVIITEKKGKKVKVINKKTKVIKKKDNKNVLDFGDRKIKDFIAVDIDRTSEEYLKIGGKYVRSFIINGYPSVVQVGWLNDLYNFDGDVDTVIHVVPSDERGALDQLTYKITQFEAQLDIESRKGNIRNITSLQDKIASLVAQRRALEQNYENLYYIQIVANVYEDDVDSLKKQTQKIINKLKGKRINVDEMYLKQEDSYKSALPIGQSFVKDKFRNFNSGALSACFPFYNSEISHKNGTFIGINMSTATPIFIDFYDRNVLNNSNASVFGQAGSGKTFFVSLLTLRSCIKGIRTVIIDPESEYKKISDIVGGANIRIASDAKGGINPFDVEEELNTDTGKYEVDIKSKVADLLNLIAVMVGGLSNEAKATVSHVIAETYKDFGMNEDPNSLYEIGSFFDEATGELIQRRKKQMPTLSNLRDNLEKFRKSSETNVEILSPIINTLGMFCKGGIYDMFDRQTSDDLKDFVNAPVVNFDISQLEESILRPIGMYIAMSWTWEKFVKKNPKIKKRIVCDEAWMLVNKNMAGHEFTAQFLENCARRIRKRNGGLLVASQNFVEFADNPQGKAVLTNSTVNIFLKQNPTDIDALQDTFKLSEGEKQFLLTAKRGEMLMRMGDESSLAYAYPFKYELNMISTNRPSTERK
jgi:type IV secretory pathway VirB4 component